MFGRGKLLAEIETRREISRQWEAEAIAGRARIAELEAQINEVAHAYDVTFKRRTELELALLPFAEFGAQNTSEDGAWLSSIHREPISTWFGPSDFRSAANLKA